MNGLKLAEALRDGQRVYGTLVLQSDNSQLTIVKNELGRKK